MKQFYELMIYVGLAVGFIHAALDFIKNRSFLKTAKKGEAQSK